MMHQMFVEHNLVVVKMNPCSDWWGPQLEKLMKPFVDAGFVRVVYGGADAVKVCLAAAACSP